ncbi:polypeptide N-acetylgalactosaminyltransferase [Mytilus galloprovincialis]|uniref:Polypeptide N-acetylgalactosaminyltransferase n=2 Tax=Mytilus galloprovincialis TaxID=29158 RepID=A0A8B6E6X8_MYTGA|nr:polypeptide N-acetylgalactosaminyltransferase [Mytilus galloprovincialis]
MRLRTRYIGAGVAVFLMLLTYEVYVYSADTKWLISNGLLTKQDYIKKMKSTFVQKVNLSNSNAPVTFKLVPNIRKGPKVSISAEEFRKNDKIQTGNILIDNYGKNDPMKNGEKGRGVTFVGQEKRNASELMQKYQVNILASDIIPLNRLVPDARPPGCKYRTYAHDLPTTSIIIPFYDEWPSILIRTLYSIINRTPRHLLQEIILVDDNSQMAELKRPLDEYISDNFPKGIIKVLRNPSRLGLIKARLKGWRESTGQVVVFFDSHMEVNIDWLQPLLTEVKKDRKTIAMGVLDYVNAESFEYRFNEGYMTRYGFDWRLVFFETFFRQDQIGATEEDVRPGTVMVGAAYAVDSKYFGEIGAYDEGMTVWGGENLEMSWRVWMCGGRFVHLPCSHLGHIARVQPYDFPGGRRNIEVYNYKRAVEVWMEPNHKQFVYDHFPEMATINAGDLSERFKLKEKLQCKNFTWFITNVWQELSIFDHNVFAWGSARNLQNNQCLDNHSYLFQAPEALYVEICHYKLATQGFSWTKEKLLRTSLQCVVVKDMQEGTRPILEDCIIGPRDQWDHTKSGFLKHMKSGFCLDHDGQGPIMRACNSQIVTQHWQFNHYNF